ncbi:hypothetical protein FFI89_029120 [Bradyrhizobium sp. KBS0727]|uniref:hypothetical protein n=1 Tax=unclassified Bradyrhizobium TaxID=2631580 RepID=UPI00110D670A|nr:MULTISPECIES: hypothetical protein [unclassified Bradyrhizobium]QDW40832.1 hypothetical protein FFI71_029125 [Bradyrhizobium sp. KBS0725]QDW47438.1 hypothetical protein FFI89_029120 [Bradyrhizobium sp. KBS0727]
MLADADRHFAGGVEKGVYAMTVKTFFAIIAVLALVHGVGFVLAPEQVAASYGMATSAATLLMARLFGAALVGLGLIFWFARDGSSEFMRSVFIATIVGDAVGLIVVVMGTAAGTLNAMGWIAALIYLFGAAGSGYFVMARPPQLSSR